MMNWENANETDVREDLLVPLLARLGYRRGSRNDIVREQRLSYGHQSLGRRKKTDPKLGGIADYVLHAGGLARWVLEAKAPHVEISELDIEQTLSYARHPDISAVFAVISNGREIRIYESSQKPQERPLAKIIVKSVEQAVESLESSLTPEVLVRQFTPQVISIERPIARGMRAAETIKSGFSRVLSARWDTNVSAVGPEFDEVDDACSKLVGIESSIRAGRVLRSSDGAIVANIEWNFPHQELLGFADRKGIVSISYVTLDEYISRDPAAPSTFEGRFGFTIEEGESLFDLLAWQNKPATVSAQSTAAGQISGYIDENNIFVGFSNAWYDFYLAGQDEPMLRYFVEGSVEIELA